MTAETSTITVPYNVPAMADLLREHNAMSDFPMPLWLAATAQHGTEHAASLWDDATRYLLKRTPVTRLAVPLPEDLADLAEAGFTDEHGHSSLPGIYHLPAFDGLGQPNAWLCSVCWTDGVMNGWPCTALMSSDRRRSVALAEHLGLEWSA